MRPPSPIETELAWWKSSATRETPPEHSIPLIRAKGMRFLGRLLRDAGEAGCLRDTSLLKWYDLPDPHRRDVTDVSPYWG